MGQILWYSQNIWTLITQRMYHFLFLYLEDFIEKLHPCWDLAPTSANKINLWNLFLKFIYILSRPQNFAKSPPYFWRTLHRTKVRWRFRKILWLPQNIWTLPPLVSEFCQSWLNLMGSEGDWADGCKFLRIPTQ